MLRLFGKSNIIVPKTYLTILNVGNIIPLC